MVSQQYAEKHAGSNASRITINRRPSGNTSNQKQINLNIKIKMTRNQINRIKSAVRDGFAWPGGYELVFITSDGALLCTDCVRKNWRNVISSCRNDDRDGWKIDGIGYEAISADCAKEVSEDLVSYCDQCNKEFGELDACAPLAWDK